MKLTSIRKRRIQLRVSDEYAMEVLGLKQSTFYKVETGHQSPSLDVVIKMSKLYKCTIDDICRDLSLI